VRSIRLSCSALTALLLLATPAPAQVTGSYTAPAEFMNLFFDFTGSEEPDYPAGQPTLGQMVTQSAKESAGGAPGPLVLVVGSDIYVYDTAGGARLGAERFRADRASGFYELTAISHIGPALAYLAQIKANGDARWQARLASLRTHTAQVRALNRRAADNWLDRLNQPAWSAHKAQIRAMVDYACARTLSYIDSLGNGDRFTTAGVNDDFFNGTSTEYPIPFVNVMIGTFARGPARCRRRADLARPAQARLAACDGAGEQPRRQQCLVGTDRRDQLAGAVSQGGIGVQPAR
jgi:hypothetical protein